MFILNLRTLQIEVTSRCNFNCEYCMRQFWENTPRDMSLDTFKEILNNFQAERTVLYGFGEPLIHEDIEEMAKLASKDSEVVLVTNGSLSVERVLKHVDLLGISLDSVDPEYLKRVRRNSEFEIIAENIKRARKETNVELEVVLTRENLEDLPNFVEWAGNLGVNVSLSNLVPYSREMYDMTVFVEFSKRTLEIYEEMMEEYPKKERFLLDVALGVKEAVDLHTRIWERSKEEGYSINILRLTNPGERLRIAERAEKIFERCRDISESFGIDLSLPEVFGDEKRRECPYEDGIFVRSDGKIAPCMEFAYTHPEYLNGHEKTVREHIIGEISEFEEDFQERKKRLRELTPWCGNCQYVEFCWYVEESRDCYGNRPSCSECLYSANISRCIL